MSCLLHGLPNAVLDELVRYALDSAPSLRVTFLASLGSHLHGSAIRVLFKTLEVADEQIASSAADHYPHTAVCALFTNPGRYAVIVKTLVVCDSEAYTRHTPIANNGTLKRFPYNTSNPADANTIYHLLELCPNLDGLVWESVFPPPEGLCEVLMSKNLRLSRLTCVARNQPPLSPRCSVAKWNALSLPLLMYLPITSLHLSGLSQSGARAFSALLSNLGQGSTLEDLNINFVWLDDSLCEKIAEAGWKLRRLCISTSGTKLSDKGLVSILEECEALEDLALVDVQGRLSRQLWAKPEHYPSSLHRLKIVVSEAGPHHSWTTDHLNSLHALPLEKFSSLFEHGADDSLPLNIVPTKFAEKMREGRSLKDFECDFWAWPLADVKAILEACQNLQKTMKISLDFAFSKLSSLTSTFASLPVLRRLSVSINHIYAPGIPPRLLHPLIPNSIPTPAESPNLKSKSVLPQLLNFDQMQTQTCVSKLAGDPSMPPLRDIKRFVRKCPQLSLLEWYGKAGRGSWVIARPVTSSKTSINVSVDYKQPSVSHDVWRNITGMHELDQRSKHEEPWRNIERIGHLWTGEAAEALARETVKDSAFLSPIEIPQKLKEPTGKKAKHATLSLVSPGSMSNQSPEETFPPLSPVSSSFPLTPPHSERSFSEYNLIPRDPMDQYFSETPGGRETANHRRTPSKPASRIGGSSKGRTRSATASSSQDNYSQRQTSPEKLVSSAAPNGEAKRGRGRGGASGQGRKYVINSSENCPGRGRGSKTSYPSRGRKPTKSV